MARKPAAKKENPKEALLREAKDRFKLALDAWSDNRKLWLEDMKFLAGDQWPDEIKRVRQMPNKERPMLTVDKLGQFVRQVINDGRQNRPSVKVRPVDGSGDVEVADAFQGIIRHIWDESRGDQAADTALEHAVKGGFGFIRLATDYVGEDSFEQKICIKRIRNPLSALLDPNIQEADGSDACYGFVISELPKDRFKAKHPQAKNVDWAYDAPKYSDGWLSDDNVRVVEYFYKVEEPTTLHLLEDGTTVTDEDYQKALAELGEQPPIENTRQVPMCKVKWARLTGAEILEENDWPGKYIPLIPVFGNEEDIEGKVIYSGLIRKAKDAQRLYNYSRSAFAERIALTPKAPFIGANEAVADFIDDWESANTANLSILRYRARDPENPEQLLPPPQRQNPTDVPAGFAQDAQMSEHDIQAAMGMYNASLGEKSNEKSGKAILARQREGDTATYHFQDNQSRAIGYLGLQLVDLIPKIIDSRRAIRLLGEDGKTTPAMVDPDQQQPVMTMNGQDGKPLKIYNLSAGKYDLSVSSGPSYNTKRMEAAASMIEITQANPNVWATHGDLIVKAQDWPGAEEFAKRTLLTMPPELRQMIEDGENTPLPPQVQAAMQEVQQAQQAVQQAQAELQAAAQQIKAEKADVEVQNAKLDAAKSELESREKVLQAKYEELSAKLELQAMKISQPVPQEMPPGKEEPAIAPDVPDEPEPPPGGFFTPEGE